MGSDGASARGAFGRRATTLVGVAPVGAGLALALGLSGGAAAQEAMRGLDMDSPAMTVPDATRAEVETLARTPPADLEGRHLATLDLSALPLSGAQLKGAFLNGARLSGADLSGARLDLAWAMDADLPGAELGGADLTGARVAGAVFVGADLTSATLAELAGESEATWAGARNLARAFR